MRAIQLRLNNFKKFHDTIIDLRAFNLLIGPNGAGKSTLIQAIAYAMTGRIGKLKQNVDIFEIFASGDVMSVQVIFNDGTNVKRTLTEKVGKSGSISFKEDLVFNDGIMVFNNSKAKPEIQSHYNPLIMAYDFDSEFQQKNATERRDTFLSLVNLRQINHAEALSYVRGAILSKDMEEDSREVFKAAIAVLEGDKASRMIGDELLERLTAIAESKFQSANSARKIDSGGSQKLSQLKNEIEGNESRVKQLEKDKEENAAFIIDAEKKLTEAKGIIERKKKAQQHIVDKKSEIEDLKKRDFDKEHAEIQTKIDSFHEIIKELPEVIDPSPDKEAHEKLLRYHQDTRHAGYAVTKEMFPMVGECLVATLAEVAGDDWNERYEKAWIDAYGAITALTLAGYPEA